jgi:hypothetical protein
MADIISERVIEDILSTDKSILADILGITPTNLELIARQKIVPSGKLDLLYLYDDEILLIELKVVRFYDGIVTQINGYEADLKLQQQQHKLIDANIRKIILVTGFSNDAVNKCTPEKIALIAYSPEDVMARYFENFKELSYFLKIQSADYGVFRLALIN